MDSVKFSLDRKYCILGLEMGLGKTLCAIATAIEAKASCVLIVVPAFLKSNWEQEIAKFTEGFEATIVSYSQLKKVEGKFDFIIADECHYLKNHQTKRAKFFESLLDNSDPEYLLMLSGTPIKNRVGEFWNLLRLCHKGGKLSSFDDFSRKNNYFKFQYFFSNAVTQWFGNREVVKFEGMRNIDKLSPMVNSCRLRMKSKDVMDLPDMVNIDFKIKDKSKYDKDFKELFTLDLRKNNETYMLVKKNNAIAKCGCTIKLASEIIDSGEKVVIFTDHVQPSVEIARALGVEAINGKMPPEQRARRVQEFESDRTAVALVATIGSLSVGVNLTSASYMVFNDLPFVPADLDQAKKRIHRIGQTKKCFYYYVYISDLDRRLQSLIYSKRKIIEAL